MSHRSTTVWADSKLSAYVSRVMTKPASGSIVDIKINLQRGFYNTFIW